LIVTPRSSTLFPYTTLFRSWAMAGMAAALPLAACAATGDGPPRLGEGECNADGVQGMIGQKATAESGAELLAKTGARTLRWVPPDRKSTRLNSSHVKISYAV